MLHEFHVIYSVWYYLWIHVTGIRSWNVLAADTGALLYMCNGMMLKANALYLPE
jgi:hypothetical protein